VFRSYVLIPPEAEHRLRKGDSSDLTLISLTFFRRRAGCILGSLSQQLRCSFSSGDHEIRQLLTPLARRSCPLLRPIKRADTVWIEPRYEAEVVFTEMTSDGLLRLPSFKGLLQVA
jgi:hypothetical protein